MELLCTISFSHPLTIHLGPGIFTIVVGAYEPLLHGMVTLLVMWLLLLWMYRRRLFVKI